LTTDIAGVWQCQTPTQIMYALFFEITIAKDIVDRLKTEFVFFVL
jgi:hypothetical protein